jgi:hypothetical protein
VKGKPFVIGFFVFVAVFAAVSFYYVATVGRTTRSLTAITSPDGKYKAVTLTMSHSGATPYCFDSVAVILAVYPDDFGERNKRYEVFAGPCVKFADGAPSPKIEWLSPTQLRITHAANEAGAGKVKHVMNDIDVTKVVHVTFVERK